jgi:hypothetical protein
MLLRATRCVSAMPHALPLRTALLRAALSSKGAHDIPVKELEPDHYAKVAQILREAQGNEEVTAKLPETILKYSAI